MDEIEFLKDVVAIPSLTGRTDKLVDFLLKECKKMGFNCKKDNAGNFIAEIGKGDKLVLLVGHIDTAPGEILVRRDNNKLHGRGSVDAKGSFASFIMASRGVKDKKIIVVGCCDEEGASNGAKFLLNKYDPNYIIIGEPSGCDGITIGYKGNIWIYYKNEKDNFHSSNDMLNAVEEGIQFYNNLINYCSNFNKNKKLFEQLNPTIEDITYKNNGLRQLCNLKIRLRVCLHFDDKDLKKIIENSKGNAYINYIVGEKPIKIGKNNLLVKAFLKSIRNNGLEPKFKLKMGTSDMNILGNHFKCPIIAYGPGDSALDHSPNEHLDLDEYEKAIKVLKTVLESL